MCVRLCEVGCWVLSMSVLLGRGCFEQGVLYSSLDGSGAFYVRLEIFFPRRSNGPCLGDLLDPTYYYCYNYYYNNLLHPTFYIYYIPFFTTTTTFPTTTTTFFPFFFSFLLLCSSLYCSSFFFFIH